ncbi:hypothetical protein MNNICLKF_02699 [Synechococcus sp. CBW1107]|nr:hypothetical protein MNNICLKF_02699 [Synechococcus sp. CBW1107]
MRDSSWGRIMLSSGPSRPAWAGVPLLAIKLSAASDALKPEAPSLTTAFPR